MDTAAAPGSTSRSCLESATWPLPNRKPRVGLTAKRRLATRLRALPP
jgi:hypothetical protein